MVYLHLNVYELTQGHPNIIKIISLIGMNILGHDLYMYILSNGI